MFRDIASSVGEGGRDSRDAGKGEGGGEGAGGRAGECEGEG